MTTAEQQRPGATGHQQRERREETVGAGGDEQDRRDQAHCFGQASATGKRSTVIEEAEVCREGAACADSARSRCGSDCSLPTLGCARREARVGGEEEEEGESEQERETAAEGSPVLNRARSRVPVHKNYAYFMHNNDDELRSSGEILTYVYDDDDDDDEDHSRRSTLARNGCGAAVEYSGCCDHDGNAEEDDSDGDLGFPENFSTPTRKSYGSDEEEEEEESEYLPETEDEYEDESLEFRSWTLDEDSLLFDEEVPTPFWFGHEDAKHIQAIVECYERELVEKPEENCRSFRPFVGSVSRVNVSSGRTFETYDTVEVCNNQRMEPGKLMPVEETVHVLTTWEAEDGLPASFRVVPRSCLEHWHQICSGKEVFYLYCEPSFFVKGQFSYSSSPSAHGVGYASLPWQSAPFDKVAPLRSRAMSLDEDFFPGAARSDIDGPLPDNSDPNWEWL